MSLGSSSLKCEGEEWVREDSCSQGGWSLNIVCLFFFMVVCACKYLCIFGLRIRCSTLETPPLVWLFTTYPEGAPLIQKGGKMAPGSWCGHSKEK